MKIWCRYSVRYKWLPGLTACLILVFESLALMPDLQAEESDPLPSWNEGSAKSSIIGFVEAVTNSESPDYIPAAQRISTFDNDGNLWSEKPVYFQLYFAMDRIKAMAAEHPEWNDLQPFKAVLDNDMAAILASGEDGLIKILMASHAGMTTQAFNSEAAAWLKTARHPVKKRLFTQLVYQPMLEVLEYLRDNDFKTFIVSGGGIDLVRQFSQEAYGIPPEQVVGSQIKKKFEIRDGKAVIVREPEFFFIDDKAGKPVGIDNHIGQRPVIASGNSDGDLQMLQWTDAGPGKSLKLLLHHTDARREWAYDRQSHIGRLDVALDEAEAKQWTVIDMAKDWKVIYPFELEQ